MSACLLINTTTTCFRFERLDIRSAWRTSHPPTPSRPARCPQLTQPSQLPTVASARKSNLPMRKPDSHLELAGTEDEPFKVHRTSLKRKDFGLDANPHLKAARSVTNTRVNSTVAKAPKGIHQVIYDSKGIYHLI